MTENNLASFLLGKSGQYLTDLLAKENASLLKKDNESFFNVLIGNDAKSPDVQDNLVEDDSDMDEFCRLANPLSLKRFFDDLVAKNLNAQR